MLEHRIHDGDREVVLQFEHSLLSLSKWEAKHKKAFLATPTKTTEDLLDYYQDMLLTPGVRREIVYRLSPQQLDELSDYINDSQTASSVPPSTEKRGFVEPTTSELIYYWMVALNIPFSAETWHLNRLMMLIQITSFKQQPEKKRNPKEMLQDWREINRRNREILGTKG